MKQESRQVRRATERQQPQYSREQWIIRFLLLAIALAVVLYALWPSQALNHRPISESSPVSIPSMSATPVSPELSDPMREALADVLVPNGYRTVSPAAPDQVILLTEEWLKRYLWWCRDKAPTAMPDDGLKAFAQLNNEFVPKFKELGISFPKVVAIDGKSNYRAELQPLINALADRNWFLNIVAPFNIGAGKSGVNFMFGPIMARRSRTLIRFDGRRIDWTEQLVGGDMTLFVHGENSMTLRKTVTHFIGKWRKEAKKVLTERELANSNDRTQNFRSWCYRLQWPLGNRALTETEILVDLLNSSTGHEEQHVRDSELMERAARSHTIPSRTRYWLGYIAEMRGMLGGIAHSDFPFYQYAFAVTLAGREKPGYYENAAGGLLQLLGKVPFDPKNPRASVAQLKSRAQFVLSEMDHSYPTIVSAIDRDEYEQTVRPKLKAIFRKTHRK